MQPPISTVSWEKLPGWEIISAGLADIAASRLTPDACAVWIASPRLQRAGLMNRMGSVKPPAEPERELYRLLRTEPGDAYSRYNALLRRIGRFEHALDRITAKMHAVQNVSATTDH